MGRYKKPDAPKPKAAGATTGWWIFVPALIAVVVLMGGMVTVLSRPATDGRRIPRIPRRTSPSAVQSLTAEPDGVTQDDPLEDPAPQAAQAPSGQDALDLSGPPPRQTYLAAVGRSPLLGYGEELKRPIAPKRLDKPDNGVSAPPLEPGQILPWHEAHRYTGRIATIEGQVVLARNTGKVCFLNFAKKWQGRFYVILFSDVLESWPNSPEIHFLNRTIRVTGKITLHNQVPQIQVKDSSQIFIVESP